MATYLERYQQGEREAVWKELVELGDKVREEPHLSDARAVANETMRRAKLNVIMLKGKLGGMGYDFVDPQSVIDPPRPKLVDGVNAFEKEVGPIPLSLRAWIDTIGSVNFMGSYPRLSMYHSLDNPTFAIGGPGGEVRTLDMDELIQEARDNSMVSPGLLNAFEKLSGFFGSMEAQKGPSQPIPVGEQIESDPLVIEPVRLSHDDYVDWTAFEEEPFITWLAPDSFHKSNVSGGDPIGMQLPDASADAPLLHTDYGDITFVEYLRLCFEWGGFPGLKDNDRRDDDLVALLKEGLLPI